MATKKKVTRLKNTRVVAKEKPAKPLSAAAQEKARIEALKNEAPREFFIIIGRSSLTNKVEVRGAAGKRSEAMRDKLGDEIVIGPAVLAERKRH